MRGHDGLTTEQAEARDLRLQGDALVRVWARILSRRGTNRGRGFSGTGEGRGGPRLSERWLFVGEAAHLLDRSAGDPAG